MPAVAVVAAASSLQSLLNYLMIAGNFFFFGSGDGGGAFELLCGRLRRGGRCGREERSTKDLVDVHIFGIVIVVVVFDVAIGDVCVH